MACVMKIEITDSYEALSKAAAKKAANYINNNPGTLVCFAAGDTPLGTFKELLLMQKEGNVDLSTVWYVGLDEWVGLGIDDKGSCIKVMHDSLYNYIPKERVRMFNGLADDIQKECSEIYEWIIKHGGIGLSLLGIGRNGHIGFNEPGTPDVEGCFTVELDEVTKSVSKKYFGKERAVTTGITIGWRTLLDSQEVILLACGINKAQIVKKAIEEDCTPDVPASMLQKHSTLTVILDKGAASLLDQ